MSDDCYSRSDLICQMYLHITERDQFHFLSKKKCLINEISEKMWDSFDPHFEEASEVKKTTTTKKLINWMQS